MKNLAILFSSIFLLIQPTSTYDIAVDNFTEISVKQIYQKQKENEHFFLYTGRKTCPYCVAFVDKLLEASGKNKIEIFYLDSSHTDSDCQLKIFRNNYKIKYVPNFTYFQADNQYIPLEITKNLTSEDISDFIDKLNKDKPVK